jgi:hypothetical protein
VWHPNGQQLFYIARRQNIMAVPIRLGERGPVLGAPASLIAIPSGEIVDNRSYAITADGRRFLVNVLVNDPSGPVMAANVWLRCLEQSGDRVER